MLATVTDKAAVERLVARRALSVAHSMLAEPEHTDAASLDAYYKSLEKVLTEAGFSSDLAKADRKAFEAQAVAMARAQGDVVGRPMSTLIGASLADTLQEARTAVLGATRATRERIFFGSAQPPYDFSMAIWVEGEGYVPCTQPMYHFKATSEGQPPVELVDGRMVAAHASRMKPLERAAPVSMSFELPGGERGVGYIFARTPDGKSVIWDPAAHATRVVGSEHAHPLAESVVVGGRDLSAVAEMPLDIFQRKRALADPRVAVQYGDEGLPKILAEQAENTQPPSFWRTTSLHVLDESSRRPIRRCSSCFSCGKVMARITKPTRGRRNACFGRKQAQNVPKACH